MSRYFCHEHPDVLLVETRVVDARPGAVLLEQSPLTPGGAGSSPIGACCAGAAARCASSASRPPAAGTGT